MLRSTTLPRQSLKGFVAPSAKATAIAGTSCGLARTRKAAMGPLFRPESGLAGAPPWAGALASFAAGLPAERGKPPLPAGPKLTYTVPNPAIAASSAAARYGAGDAFGSRLVASLAVALLRVAVSRVAAARVALLRVALLT